VTLDPPASMNAVDRTTEEELERVWQDIEADRDIAWWC
jgi:enoyl-CoA hydratase/carnithine racemase